MTDRPSAASRRRFLATAAALGTLGIATDAGAQSDDTWPSRPITIVVASAAGSGPDVLARDLGNKLATVFRQPVVIDNKPGGTGSIAAQAVQRAKPDGYTFLYSTASFMAVYPVLARKQLSFDPVRDFTPIAQTAAGGVLMMVNRNVPANNLQELIALVKANPDKYSYGTWGQGSTAHLMTEWLMRKTGMKMSHVPYKSTPQVVTDLAGGVLQIGWADPGTPLPMLEQGQIKGIAINGTVRAPRTNTIATMGEQGFTFDAVGWFALFGPAGLPKSIVERMAAEITKVQKSPEMLKRMEGINYEPPPVKTPEELRAILVRDLRTWGDIARESNITLE